MTQILHLVYKSHAKADLDKKAIDEIIKKSQVANKKLGLTGLLIYRHKTFIQLLEGDEEKVRELYSKISQDSRHEQVKTLIESKSSLRIVPQWSMNYVEEKAEQKSAESLFELFDYILDQNTKDKNLIMPLLTKFGSSLS